MKNKQKLINQIIDGFQQHRGKASAYCFAKSVIPEVVFNVVSRYGAKYPTEQIIIIVDRYNTRKSIIDFLNAQPNVSTRIKVFTEGYVSDRYNYRSGLTIIVGVNSDAKLITHLANDSKFTLCILTENIMNHEFINSVRSILPCIETADLDAAIRSDSVNSPVEEHLIPVVLSADDALEYKKYTDFINESVAIFGDIVNIDKCRVGDTAAGISSSEFRLALAKSNGWSEDIDTSIPIMKQIDEAYNPNVLYERAMTFYNITRERRNKVTDYNAKLDVVKNICLDNQDKTILVVSNRGEFAAKVTKHLFTCGVRCADYHDCLESIAICGDDGLPIKYKSGAKKGQVKMHGWQAQCSRANALFREGVYNVLSTKSSCSTELAGHFDVVIFTSSYCDDVVSLKLRLPNASIGGAITTTYRLYCADTIEETHLREAKTPPCIEQLEHINVEMVYDEISNTVIL